MRQQGGDKSVSYRVVFGEPFPPVDGDEGYIWVKLPRAAVEEQLAARPKSCAVLVILRVRHL